MQRGQISSSQLAREEPSGTGGERNVGGAEEAPKNDCECTKATCRASAPDAGFCPCCHMIAGETFQPSKALLTLPGT